MSTVYLNGDYMPMSEAKISPMDRGFLFGDGIYEVIPSYEGKLVGFGPHFERMQDGLDAIELKLKIDQEAWRLLTRPFRAKPPARVYAPQGCLECRDTGYLGRMGIYELLPMSETVGELIRGDCEANLLRRQAFKEGMKTLRLSGAQKVGAGLTTISEVLRVSPASES